MAVSARITLAAPRSAPGPDVVALIHRTYIVDGEGRVAETS
ncbi:hypothetical protein [Rhodococcus qingshengii]|nr:hypothetical protein [Rhodococcus qingshengii]